MTAKTRHNYLINNLLFISLENPEVKSQPTGVSTFAIRTSLRTDPKLQKSFHLTIETISHILPNGDQKWSITCESNNYWIDKDNKLHITE